MAKLFKLTTKDCIHNGFKFTKGLNTDTKSGFYVTDNWLEWICYNDKIMYYIWDVDIPDNEICLEHTGSKYKYKQIILTNKRLITINGQLNVPLPLIELQLNAIHESDYSFGFIANKTTAEVQLAALKHDPTLIRFIDKPSIEIQIFTLNRNIHALPFFKHKITDSTVRKIAQDILQFRQIIPDEKTFPQLFV